MDTDEWDAERGTEGRKEGRALELGEIDWNEVNDEVEAAMNESDDEDVRSENGRSGNVSEDDWTDETNSVIRLVG